VEHARGVVWWFHPRTTPPNTATESGSMPPPLICPAGVNIDGWHADVLLLHIAVVVSGAVIVGVAGIARVV
jgi:hypothetical protein